MNDATDVRALALGAAAVIVTEMAKDTWAATRSALARLFRRGGTGEEKRQLTHLDADHSAIATGDPAQLRERWQRRLLGFLEDFPEAADELAALTRLSSDGAGSGQVSQSAVNNTGPVIQVGGNNFGALNTQER